MNISIIKNLLSKPWPALLLIALTIIIYSNIYHAPFVFDDIPRIIEEEAIRDLSKYLSFNRFLNPRAIGHFTFALNYRFGEDNVFGYHLVNVLIHMINGFIVYFLSLMIFTQISVMSDTRRVKKKNKRGKEPEEIVQSSIPMMSFITALIFVAHPIQTQAVTYTVQRYASIAAMFYMGSVLCYLKARMIQNNAKHKENNTTAPKQKEQSSYRAFNFQLSAFSFYLLAILCAILAFLSKENTASLPGAILLVEYLMIDRSWQGWKKKIPWFILTFLLFVILILYVSGFFTGRAIQFSELLEDVSGRMKAAEGLSRWSYLCTQFNVLVIYIRLLFLPLGQNLDHYYPFKSGFFDDYTPLAFLFLVGIVILGIWSRKKRPLITLAIFWFFITLSVESSIILITDALFEHRLYLPMFGFALFVTYLIFHFFSKSQSWAIIISFVIIVSLGGATYMRNRVWQDDLTLWADSVSKSPHNDRAHNNLANLLMDNGNLQEAIDHFNEAARINPTYPVTYYNLGNVLAKLGKINEAISHYHKALRIKPDFAEVYVNLGVVLSGMERVNEAIENFYKAVRIRPHHAEGHYKLGCALTSQGNVKAAIDHFVEAVRLKPRYADAHNNLGAALAKNGDYYEAISHYHKALRIKPDYAETYYNLGNVLAKLGKINEAISHYHKALRIKPDYAEVYVNLGVTLAGIGKMNEANEHFRKALRIKPDYAEGHYNMGRALAAQGNLREAIDHFSEALRIEPDYADAHNNLGVALAGIGKMNEAIEHFSNALRIKPDYHKARYNLVHTLMRMRKSKSLSKSGIGP